MPSIRPVSRRQTPAADCIELLRTALAGFAPGLALETLLDRMEARP